MLITLDNRKAVENNLLYLAGAYPQLRLDTNLSADVWVAGLIEIQATEEELTEVCHKIVREGFQDWEINLSLVIEIIENRRKITKDLELTREEIKKIQATPIIATNIVKQAKEKLKSEGIL